MAFGLILGEAIELSLGRNPTRKCRKHPVGLLVPDPKFPVIISETAQVELWNIVMKLGRVHRTMPPPSGRRVVTPCIGSKIGSVIVAFAAKPSVEIYIGNGANIDIDFSAVVAPIVAVPTAGVDAGHNFRLREIARIV